MGIWTLCEVLVEKYKMEQEVAEEITDFLLPMLQWEPHKRQSAAEALKHHWLQESADAKNEDPQVPQGIQGLQCLELMLEPLGPKPPEPVVCQWAAELDSGFLPTTASLATAPPCATLPELASVI